jgi:hypothetical protein
MNRDIEIRLVIEFIVGILLPFAVVNIMKVVYASRTKDMQAILNNLSLVLFPCIIFIPSIGFRRHPRFYPNQLLFLWGFSRGQDFLYGKILRNDAKFWY